MKTRSARSQPTAPMRAIPRVTAGLKRPETESLANAGCWSNRGTLTSTDPEEDPGVYSKTETKSQSDVEQNTRVGHLSQRSIVRVCSSGCGVGDLGGRKGEEQEQKRADEFTDHSDEVIARLVGDEAQEGQAELILFGSLSMQAGEIEAGGRGLVDVHGEAGVGSLLAGVVGCRF